VGVVASSSSWSSSSELTAAVAAVDALLLRPPDAASSSSSSSLAAAVWALVEAQPSVLAKYVALEAVQVADANLFYAVLRAHTAPAAAVVYTPGIAEACLHYGELPRAVPVLQVAVGDDAAAVARALAPWGTPAVVVLTDGARVLGLGDLGVWGAPIAVGKARMHVLGAGLDPATAAVPAQLDAGTDHVVLRARPGYRGAPTARASVEATVGTVRTLVHALAAQAPLAVLHLEDFGRATAFALLAQAHAEAWPLAVFNDDIQGTGTVVLAALWAALPLTAHARLHQHTIVIVGAGQAGIGIARVRFRRRRPDGHC
jgi:malic enzyme